MIIHTLIENLSFLKAQKVQAQKFEVEAILIFIKKHQVVFLLY